MAKLGANLRCVVVDSARDNVRGLLTEVFGATMSHPTDSMDVFTLGGSNIGFDFVAAGKALSETQHREMGTWIELSVEDAGETEMCLGARGIERLEVSEQGHAYFQIPDGPVFRLANSQ